MPIRRLLAASLLVFSTSCAMIQSSNDSRLQANELAAVASLRAINTAQVQYYSTKNSYAGKLSDMSDLLPSALTSGTKSGYRFALTGQAGSYQVEATPETLGATGKKSFFTDQSMTIRFNEGPQTANAQSPEWKP